MTSRRVAVVSGASIGALLLATVGLAVLWPDPPSADPGGVVAVLDTPAGRFETHGNDMLPPKPQTLTPQAAREVGWPCEGDGTEAPRVQFLYGYSGTDDLDTLRPSFQAYARRIQAVFADSSGGQRLVRYVTDADCALSIEAVRLSPESQIAFGEMIDQLAELGYNQADRKYHVWTEAKTYCGIGTVENDDRASADNRSNGGPSYARTDRDCWDYAEAHELQHVLGAVQLSAPNSTGAWHCKDAHDLMCYADGGPKDQQRVDCGLLSDNRLLDCRDDDYFSVAPAAGSYLASHWNVASSFFLAHGATPTTGVPPTTAPPPPTTSSSTTTTIGSGDTDTTLTVTPDQWHVSDTVSASVTVTGDCRPSGAVAFFVSGRLIDRQVLADGKATALLRFTRTGRFTVRATYEGSAACDDSSDSVRKRVTP